MPKGLRSGWTGIRSQTGILADLLSVPLRRWPYLDSSNPIACEAAAIPKTEVTQTEEPNPAQLRPVAATVVGQLSCDVG